MARCEARDIGPPEEGVLFHSSSPIVAQQLQEDWRTVQQWLQGREDQGGQRAGTREGAGEEQRMGDGGGDAAGDGGGRGGRGGGLESITRKRKVGNQNLGPTNSGVATTTMMNEDHPSKLPESHVSESTSMKEEKDEWMRCRGVREMATTEEGEGTIIRKAMVGYDHQRLGLNNSSVTMMMLDDSSCKLPDHLIESVLARLPVQSILRFRTVCSSWNSLLHSTTFLKAYSEAAIRHNVWFLVVTANLGRLGRYGQRIVATYDPECNNWHRIPLPAPLCDLNPYPTAADGGLVCYFVYENRVRTLFVCNPLTKSLRKLPLVLKTSSHISVLKMVMEDRSTSAYKVFVAGMVPGETGGDSLSMEVYDSATDSWSTSGIIPARYPKRRPVYGNGILYVRCYDLRSLLLTYDLRIGAWNRIHAPLPHTLGYEELVQYQGHILLVGVLEENYKIENVCIWELLQQSPTSLVWKQVDTMPRDLFLEFFCDREYFECQEDERVLMKCCQYGDLILCVAFNISHRGPFKVMAYDLGHKRWRRLPDSFRARECRLQHKFIEGIIYEPRLDVVA